MCVAPTSMTNVQVTPGCAQTIVATRDHPLMGSENDGHEARHCTEEPPPPKLDTSRSTGTTENRHLGRSPTATGNGRLGEEQQGYSRRPPSRGKAPKEKGSPFDQPPVVVKNR